MFTKTPYYIFDREKFCAMLHEYKRYGEVYYPIKANDDELIVSEIIFQNCNFEVDSIEHIKFLVQKCAVSPERILYSYPVRDLCDIETAINMGVKLFVVDTTEEYEKIISVSPNVKIVIRINVLQLLNKKIYPQQNKWGMSFSDAKSLIKIMQKNGTHISGISFYIAAEAEHNESFEIVLETLLANFSDINIDFINIGGGISLEKLKEIESLLDTTKTALKAKNIVLEPGRHLLNPCIEMAVSVSSIRFINGHKLVFINAGIYTGLIDAIIKQRKYTIIDKKLNDNCSVCHCYLCGASSDISDTLGEYEFRDNISVGDILYIQECGAYSSVLQTRFYGQARTKMFLKESF